MNAKQLNNLLISDLRAGLIRDGEFQEIIKHRRIGETPDEAHRFFEHYRSVIADNRQRILDEVIKEGCPF